MLTRSADASKGVDAAVHVSEDGGKTWSTQKLALGPHMDIAARAFGLTHAIIETLKVNRLVRLIGIGDLVFESIEFRLEIGKRSLGPIG